MPIHKQQLDKIGVVGGVWVCAVLMGCRHQCVELQSSAASIENSERETFSQQIAEQIRIPRITLNDVDFAQAVALINLKIEEQLEMIGRTKCAFKIENNVVTQSSIVLDLKNVSVATLFLVLREQAAFEIEYTSGGVILSNPNRDRLD
jgi:hypothetical protein